MSNTWRQSCYYYPAAAQEVDWLTGGCSTLSKRSCKRVEASGFGVFVICVGMNDRHLHRHKTCRILLCAEYRPEYFFCPDRQTQIQTEFKSHLRVHSLQLGFDCIQALLAALGHHLHSFWGQAVAKIGFQVLPQLVRGRGLSQHMQPLRKEPRLHNLQKQAAVCGGLSHTS